MRDRKVRIEIVAWIVLSGILCAFQFTNVISSSAERGKLIYTQGVRASGIPIEAQLSGATFDAKILPCSNCHGSRGEGNPEGGVEPSLLDWSSLTKPYTVEFKNGRKRTGYNHRLLKRAIVEGIDPSDNILDMVMPRYALNDEDVSDLIAYLKIIAKEDLTGVTDSLIHIGVMLSYWDQNNYRAEAITNTIRAYLDLVNRGGGVYNRKFHLSQFIIDDSIEETDSVFNSILERDDIFAFIASDLENIPPKSLATLESRNIPVIGAITGNPEKKDYIRNHFYYLFAGTDQEIQTLAHFAKDSLGANHDGFVVLYDSSTFKREIDLVDIFGNQKIRIEQLDSDEKNVPHQINQLKKDGIEYCLFLGDAPKGSFLLDKSLESKWNPKFLIPGKFASTTWLDMPVEMNNSIYLSYPVWIADRNELAMEQYDLMATHYKLDSKFKNAQLNGLAATILFTETLKLAGKEIDRESILETMYGLKNFDSGFVAPISFGPNKRIGTDRISIVKADLVNKKLVLAN